MLAPRHLHRDGVSTPLPAERPGSVALGGSFVTLEPLDPDSQATSLFDSAHGDAEKNAVWEYLPYGPFDDLAAFTDWHRERAKSKDPLFFTLRDHASDRHLGMASYLNIVPAHGSIEIGHIWFAPALQRSPAATEALFLMIRQAFEQGYRRVEWKCNAMNEGSRNAALRLGFAYEGVFYRHMVVKGVNRDTAWFSLLAEEWPPVRTNFETWLSKENFDAEGRQRQSLSAMNRALRPAET